MATKTQKLIELKKNNQQKDIKIMLYFLSVYNQSCTMSRVVTYKGEKFMTSKILHGTKKK